jgi:hypothetical protein
MRGEQVAEAVVGIDAELLERPPCLANTSA